MKQGAEYFISCDWGTTNFRLRLVETASLRVLSEHSTDQGVKVLYNKFSKADARDQFHFFLSYLEQELEQLVNAHWAQVVVLSGMASSNIGLFELEYAALPFSFDGSSLNSKVFTTEKGTKLLLISGVSIENGMMRGEEVQAIGLSKYLSAIKEGLLILPGTHSKHILFNQDGFYTFKTYMTGELFKLLSQDSILAKSVETNTWLPQREKAFLDGFAIGFAGELSSNLFSVRARQLKQLCTKEDNFYYLSGLLIGDEMAYLKGTTQTIVLSCSNPLFQMYSTALNKVFATNQTHFLDEHIFEMALLAGQKKILLAND